MDIPKNILFFDCETNGLIPGVHEILSFAAISPNGDEVSYNVYVNPAEAITCKTAMDVNGISLDEHNAKSMTAKSVVELFLDYLLVNYDNQPIILCGKNIGFDFFMLLHLFRKVGEGKTFETRFSHNVADLHTMISLVDHVSDDNDDPSIWRKAPILYEQYLNLEPEPYPHRALTGARLAKQTFEKIINLILS